MQHPYRWRMSCDARGIVTLTCRRAALLALCIAVATPAALSAKRHDDRLRTLDQHLEELLDEGIVRSETFRSLVRRLTGGDVVVYIRYETLPSGVHGRLVFLTVNSGLRYVLVAVTPDLDALRSIVVLGHELRHAVEVLEQPQIVDQETFASAYEHGSYRRRQFADGRTGFDTIAAVHAGVAVWKELATSPLAAPVVGTR
jgi:hypothetical protein